MRREILAWLKDPKAYFEERRAIPSSMASAPATSTAAADCPSRRCPHLAVLQRAGLITATKVGQWVFFRRNEALIAAFLRQLNQDM